MFSIVPLYISGDSVSDFNSFIHLGTFYVVLSSYMWEHAPNIFPNTSFLHG